MMLYLMFVPVVVAQVFFILHLIQLRRDDIVKFGYCELQRNAVLFLSTPEGAALDRNDYAFMRWMLTVNALTVEQFNTIKSSFNLSGTLKSLRFFDNEVVKPAHRLDDVTNQKVHVLYHSMISHTVSAFAAYTPFLKSRVLLRLCLSAAELLAVLGAKRVYGWTREMLDRWTSLMNENGNYCPV